MNKITETKLYEFIRKNIKEEDLEDMFIKLITKYKHALGFKLSKISMMLVINSFSDLEDDFNLLRKACSENLTLNKEYTQKELNKTRKEGVGFYEAKTMQEIFIAGTRKGKENFPIYLPQTEKYLPKIQKSKIKKK